LLEALDSGWIAPLGPQVDAFEREFGEVVAVPNTVALSSGTAALHLALVLLSVGAGDDVLTSTLTFAATANAICYTRARPAFVDSDRASWNMDPDLLLSARVARRGDHVSARGVVLHLESLAHGRDDRRRPLRRIDPPRGGRNRGAPGLEADAPANGVSLGRVSRRRGRGGDLREGALPPERIQFVGFGPGARHRARPLEPRRPTWTQLTGPRSTPTQAA
jgi:hypothetical protein